MWWRGSGDCPAGAVVVESEVGEALEVDCGGAQPQPVPVLGGAEVGASSGSPDEPGDAALGEGPISPVVVLELGGAGLGSGGGEQVVVGVDLDAASCGGCGAA